MDSGNAVPKSGHGHQRRHYEAVNSLGGIAGGGEAPVVDADAHVREHGFEKRHYEEAVDSFDGAEGDKASRDNEIVREDSSEKRNCLESVDSSGNGNGGNEQAFDVYYIDVQKLSPVGKRSVEFEIVDSKNDVENGSKASPEGEDKAVVQEQHLGREHYQAVHSLGGIAGGREDSQVDVGAGHQQSFERRHYE